MCVKAYTVYTLHNISITQPLYAVCISHPTIHLHGRFRRLKDLLIIHSSEPRGQYSSAYRHDTEAITSVIMTVDVWLTAFDYAYTCYVRVYIYV